MAPSIMFHHFYNENHPYVQGAFSEEQFEKLIQKLLPIGLVSASDWQEKYISGNLNEYEFCLTFDDSLKSQYDIAFPLLRKYNLNGYWFIYTSPLDGIVERLELYRFFRNICFKDIDDYYEFFFDYLYNNGFKEKLENVIKKFDFNDYLKEYDFYSLSDKKYRYVRDNVLGKENYFKVLDNLIEIRDFKINQLKSDIWIDKFDLLSLNNAGNIIGLHSHTHPTKLQNLNFAEQLDEYNQNFQIIKSITGKDPISMAHPANSYNQNTLDVLSNLGIKIGFKSSDNDNNALSNLELPRIDCNIIINKLGLK